MVVLYNATWFELFLQKRNETAWEGKVTLQINCWQTIGMQPVMSRCQCFVLKNDKQKKVEASVLEDGKNRSCVTQTHGKVWIY